MREAGQARRLALAWGAAALGLLALAPLAPRVAGLVAPCLFKAATGIPCPLCGATRAALDLARLDPLHALAHYPLPAALWLGFAAGGLAAGAAALLRRPLPRPRAPRWAGPAFAVAVAANWVYCIATGV